MNTVNPWLREAAEQIKSGRYNNRGKAIKGIRFLPGEGDAKQELIKCLINVELKK